MKADIEVTSSRDAVLRPAPIPPQNVLAGNPVARNALLYKSIDGLQFTLMWHCTAGSFRWYYDEDETVMLLEGGMTLHYDDGRIQVCRPGDVVYFRAGGTCVWVIEKEVRKIAFFREPSPALLALPVRLMRKLRDKMRAAARARPAAPAPEPAMETPRSQAA
jgi:uncharacterized cupin superfamily protein